MSRQDGLAQEAANSPALTSHTAGKSIRQQRHSKRLGQYPSGAWREEVKARSTRLEAEALWIQESGHDSSDRQGLMQSQIFDPLHELNVLLSNGFRWNVFKKLLLWFHGSEIEECWRLLRQAEEGLLIVDSHGVRSHAELALAHGKAILSSKDPLVQSLAKELDQTKQTDDSTPLKRETKLALQRSAFDVLGRSHEATDAKHRQMRGFRNQLLVLSGVLLILAVVLILLQQFVIDGPLVPPPSGSAVTNTTALILVMFFGCVGALFSAVPSLAQIPETGNPFELVQSQAALKCVIGIWSAVVGILVVKAGIATAEADSATLAGLFMVAALFGAGQEAITRFADHKATTIRSGVEKD